MDYEVFLVSRIREAYVRSGNPREAIVTGLPHRMKGALPDVDIEGEQLLERLSPSPSRS